MADIIQKEHWRKTGVPKLKKATVRVDLTPMVDLGFLLITFFVFTTSIIKPTVMKIGIPDDREVYSSKVPSSKTLNLILGDSNKIFVYDGDDMNALRKFDNRAALREEIFQKKNLIKERYGTDTGMIVLIKPTSLSTYENVVNAFDEMLICNIKTYVLMDATGDEVKAIDQTSTK